MLLLLVALLFASRAVLAIASSVMWVVGFTTVANAVSIHNTGKSYAAISVASSLGASSGPMVSGILFQLAGYWAAWICAFVLLGVDMVFRLLMVEKQKAKKTGMCSHASRS
jgi:MFS family permease